MNPRQFAPLAQSNRNFRIFAPNNIGRRCISYGPACSYTQYCAHTINSTNASLGVPKYPQIYPIICRVLKLQNGVQKGRNSTPEIYFSSQGLLGLAPDAGDHVVMLAATSGPRRPINSFVVTLGIICLLVLNHIPPSITFMTYPLPVFAIYIQMANRAKVEVFQALQKIVYIIRRANMWIAPRHTLKHTRCANTTSTCGCGVLYLLELPS
jgi:hypothetical protein